jgi:hypothetical protein
MSDPNGKVGTMKRYRVDYTASYWVEALDEDEAIDLAIEEHSKLPDGDWEAIEIVEGSN